MNQNTTYHLRSLELAVHGDIIDIKGPIEGKGILEALAEHLDACGIACKLPDDKFAKTAIEKGIPISTQKAVK